MNKYFVVDIENNPLPMSFDIYYIKADTVAGLMDLVLKEEQDRYKE